MVLSRMLRPSFPASVSDKINLSSIIAASLMVPYFIRFLSDLSPTYTFDSGIVSKGSFPLHQDMYK